MNIISSIKLLFFPKAFADAMAQENKQRATEAKNKFNIDEWNNVNQKRIAKKRKGKLVSLILVSTAVITAFFIAKYVNSNFQITIEHLRYVRLLAIIVVGWAVMGRVGYETTTMSGESLLERTSADIFKILYLLGIFITTIALFLEPSSFNNLIQSTPDGAG